MLAIAVAPLPVPPVSLMVTKGVEVYISPVVTT